MSSNRSRGDLTETIGVDTTQLSAFRQTLNIICSSIAAVGLALETILFALGIHPGYLLHRLSIAMNRIRLVMGLRGDGHGDRQAATTHEGTRAVAKRRNRVSYKSRNGQSTRMHEQGEIIYPLYSDFLH
jgi:hypothetical protein